MDYVKKTNELAAEILDICFEIHRKLGPGLLESVYEEILSFELNSRSLAIKRQYIIPVQWKGITLNKAFVADIIVENKVLIELKSVETLSPTYAKQVITYLKLTNIKLGLLINFNEALLKHGIRRLVNNL